MKTTDSDKLRLLYELYEQPMYRIAAAVLNDPDCAEDAVADAFEHIVRNIKRIGEPDSPRTKSYIVKTIKNASIDIYRRNRIRLTRTQPIDDSVVQIPDDSVNIEKNALRGNVDELTKCLNDTDRRIVRLRFGEELSWREVAEKMSMTESAVRKRFERAKSTMKGELQNEKY